MDCIFTMDMDQEDIQTIQHKSTKPRMKNLVYNINTTTNEIIQKYETIKRNSIQFYNLDTFSRSEIRTRMILCDIFFKNKDYSKVYRTLNNTLCNLKESHIQGLKITEIDYTTRMLRIAIIMMFWCNHKEVGKIVKNIKTYLN